MAKFTVSDVVRIVGPKDVNGSGWADILNKTIGKQGRVTECLKHQSHWYYCVEGVGNGQYFHENWVSKADPTAYDILKRLKINHPEILVNSLNKGDIDKAKYEKISKYYAKRFKITDKTQYEIEFDNTYDKWERKSKLFKCDDCGKWFNRVSLKEANDYLHHCEKCFNLLYTRCACGRCWVGKKTDPNLVKVYDRTENVQGLYFLPNHGQMVKQREGKWYLRVKIPAWHQSPRAWDARPPITQQELYGVELEVWCTDRTDVYDKIEFDQGYVGELDSSLCTEHGLEIVGPPIPLADYYGQSLWAQIIEEVKKNGGRAYDAGRNYGMHVNVNKNQFAGREHIADFVCFIHDNKQFCEAIAGRTEEDVEEAVHGHKPFTYAPRLDREVMRTNPAFQQRDKYQAVFVKERVCEVRIFRATLKWGSFLKNIEFCAAVFEFTKTGYKPLKDFLLFVKAHKTKYNYLHRFLFRKKLL